MSHVEEHIFFLHPSSHVVQQYMRYLAKEVLVALWEALATHQDSLIPPVEYVCYGHSRISCWLTIDHAAKNLHFAV